MTEQATSREVLVLPERGVLAQKFQAVQQFQALVKTQMIEGHDYGVIPGTNKPTLLKPGAEKLAKLLELADTYDVLTNVEDWERPFFAYTVCCRLKLMSTEVVVSEGLGECNSYEGKYRYRWLWPRDASEEIKRTAPTKRINTRNGPVTQYRVENDDVYSLVNTILKMAKKRALVDAALSAGRLSDIFTQDMDDIQGGVIEGEARDVPPDASERAERDVVDDEPRSTVASAAQLAHIDRLLADVDVKYGALPVELELPALMTDLQVPQVAKLADWLNRRKRELAKT